MHTFKPSIGETKAEGSLLVPDWPGLYCEYQNSQIYTERPCLKNKKGKHKKERRKRSLYKCQEKYENICQYENRCSEYPSSLKHEKELANNEGSVK